MVKARAVIVDRKTSFVKVTIVQLCCGPGGAFGVPVDGGWQNARNELQDLEAVVEPVPW
jgi:hypothetical protein